MFSATLTVKHESTGQSYQLKVSSLGSVLELVEGFQGIIEEQYNMLFPEIPSLFYGGKEDEEDSVGIPSCPIPLEVMEYQEDPVQVPGGIQRLTHKHQRKKQEDFLDSLEPFK